MNEIYFQVSKDGHSVAGCEITELVIPEGITTIEEEAFSNMKALKRVKLPSTLTTIKDSAFAGCESLEEINIPASLSMIENAAFLMCSSLKNVNIEPGNQHFVVDHGILYSSDRSIFIRALNSPENSTITLGSKQKMHHVGAITACPSVEHITFTDSAQMIPENSFCQCSNLKHVDLLEGLVCIGRTAFYGTAIENIDIPNSVKEIQEGAFASCKSLSRVTIPKNVQVISTHTFDRCISLKEVMVSDNLCLIEDDAFNGCHDELSIIVPDGKIVGTYIDDRRIKDYVCSRTYKYSKDKILFVPLDIADNIKGGKVLNYIETMEKIDIINSNCWGNDDSE